MFEPTKYELEKAHHKQKLVRNDVKCVGKFGMPLIQKQDIDPYMIHFINFTDTKRDDVKNAHKTVHFFTYDWLYDKVYDDYENQLDVLKQYKAVLSPEFSIYTDMPIALQIYNTFKNRWCGAYWQKNGITVIPTICWGDERSFDFCFDGGRDVQAVFHCRTVCLIGRCLLCVVYDCGVVLFQDQFGGFYAVRQTEQSQAEQTEGFFHFVYL